MGEHSPDEIPGGWPVILLVVTYLLTILTSTGILSNHFKNKRLCILVGCATILAIAFLIASFLITKREIRNIIWLITCGLFFVILSALVFSLYFETIEIILQKKGFSEIGILGWALIIICVVALGVFKFAITKLRET